jgi:hypothetical protein
MNKKMTKALIGAVVFIVLIPFGLAAQDEGFYPYSYARLSYVNGSVYVQRTADLGYEKGEVNLALVQGDKMGTENGQAEVHFGRRNYLRLADNTKLEFAVLPQESDERIKIHLTEGSVYLRVSYLAVDKGIEVHTPDASYYILEEGLYRFDVRLDSETVVFVREGSLEAAASEGSVLVREKETVTASDGRLAGDPEYYYSREDTFDDWNGSRDAQLAQRSERQYLPSDIGEYEEELDQNGQWVYERPYGNVWVPNVSYSDWRPYFYGRWVWYPVIGWTWVSSESWGWPVYHYGRWNWRFGLGWYWIPRNHWGPAWVHWWSDNNHIGWCPLTWYNRPGLLVDNRFYDRFDDRYFSAHNGAMTVVRRDHLQSPDIGRHQIGRGELDRIDRVALKAEQPRVRPAVDNMRPQALEAKRALAARPGSRNTVKSLPSTGSGSPTRLRQGTASSGARPRERDASIAGPDRGAVSRPAIKNPETGSRAIRSYPSQKVAGTRDDSRASEGRRAGVAAPARRNGSEVRETPSRVAPTPKQGSVSDRAGSGKDQPNIKKKNDNESGSAAVKRGGVIKNYPSSSRSEASSFAPRSTSSGSYPSRVSKPDAQASRSDSGNSRRSVAATSSRAQTPAYSPRSSVSRQEPRVNRSTTSRASSPSYSRPSPSRSPSSGRSSAPSYSRPSSSRSPSYSQPRSSYSAPSRSSGSSGRSVSSPRSSGSSSGRSYSAPRSSGSSSSGGVKSSGRSSSSSSRSSGSSSKSGSVKKKG